MKTRDPEKLYFETNKTYRIEARVLKRAVKNITEDNLTNKKYNVKK